MLKSQKLGTRTALNIEQYHIDQKEDLESSEPQTLAFVQLVTGRGSGGGELIFWLGSDSAKNKFPPNPV